MFWPEIGSYCGGHNVAFLMGSYYKQQAYFYIQHLQVLLPSPFLPAKTVFGPTEHTQVGPKRFGQTECDSVIYFSFFKYKLYLFLIVAIVSHHRLLPSENSVQEVHTHFI